MPVLATLAAIALLRGDGNSPGPFFDPQKMREMLTDGLEGVADDELKSSLAIVAHLESQLERYRASVDESFDVYTEELADPKTGAADLIARLEPLDRERMKVLESVIKYRQELIGVLDESSWAAVFDDLHGDPQSD